MRFIYPILTFSLIFLPFTFFSNPIIGLAIILGWFYVRRHSVKKVVVYLESFSMEKTVKQDWKGYLFSSIYFSIFLLIVLTILGSLFLLVLFSLYFPTPAWGDFLYRSIYHLVVDEEGDFNGEGLVISFSVILLTVFLTRKLLLPKWQTFLLCYLFMTVTGVVGHYAGFGYTYNNGTILNNFSSSSAKDVRSQYMEQDVKYVEDDLEIEEVSFDKKSLETSLQTVLSEDRFGPFESNWIGKTGEKLRDQYGIPDDIEYVEKHLGSGDRKYIYDNYAFVIEEYEGIIKEIWYEYPFDQEDIYFDDVTSIIGEPDSVQEENLTYYYYYFNNYQLIFEVSHQRVNRILFLVIGQIPVQTF